MATPRGLLWPRDQHTAAKHAILRRYLQAWFPIIAQRFPAGTYVDAFSGPGEYVGGEPGSPIIAIEVASASDAVATKPIRIVLLEAEQRRVEHLRGQVEARCPAARRPASLRVSIDQGECATDLVRVLDRESAWGQPIFALLDQFGGAQVPFSVIRRIARNTSSEVMVTLAVSFFTRFVSTHPDVGDEVFGSPDWRAVADQPSDRKHDFLAERYRDTLARAGFRYTLSFEMVDEGGHPLYLLFGTSNDRGLARMKDAMWKVDPISGLTFRDPRDADQLTFDLAAPSFDALEPFLLRRLEAGGASVRELRFGTLTETIYREEHVLEVLRRLRRRGLLDAGSGRLGLNSVVRRA